MKGLFSSIVHLGEVDDVLDYVRIVKNLYEGNFHFNPSTNARHLFFRGHKCLEWELLPSVFRNEKLKKAEHDIILDAKQFAKTFGLNYDFELELPNVLIDMQHGELPTRMIDWSVEPLKALYFCVEADCDGKEEGAVWIFNPWKYNNFVIDYNIPQVHDAAILARALLGYGWNNIYIQDYLNRHYSENAASEVMRNIDLPVALVGAFSNRRKIAQNGCFLIYGKDDIAFENIPKSVDCLAYITVKNKPIIKEQLNNLFINAFSVYPDFTGAKKQLERYGSFFKH